MADKSYYLEKAKLEKEGLDPVSLLSCSSFSCEERERPIAGAAVARNCSHSTGCGESFSCRFQFVFLFYDRLSRSSV